MKPSSSMLAAALLLVASSGPMPQAAELAPTYLRQRPGANDWLDRSGGAVGYGWAHPGLPYGYYTPLAVGSWYTRPYPYHLDYYRYRWGGAGRQPGGDCPCAVEPAAIDSLPPEG